MDIKKRKEEVRNKMQQLVPNIDHMVAQTREFEAELNRLVGEMRLLQEIEPDIEVVVDPSAMPMQPAISSKPKK
jgi:predicted nuclease with TOPRIM domain